MFKVLIADDNYEDRELLKLEIRDALNAEGAEIKFNEASNIKKALEYLKNIQYDLLTLDIEFDRLDEGLDALPDIFEEYPTLNIIVISGKLSKNEVAERLFRFTKDNILKGKRWLRHFDVLDKKDDKNEALKNAYNFAFKQKEKADNLRDLFVLAESYLEKEEMDKCMSIYQKIQDIAPGERESGENIKILEGHILPEQVLQYLRSGNAVVASLLLGHYVERRLKAFTRRRVGRAYAGLSDCLKEMERSHRIKPYKVEMFSRLMKQRNKAIHRPSSITENDVQTVYNDIKMLEAKV